MESSDTAARAAALSGPKRRLLEERLRGRQRPAGPGTDGTQIRPRPDPALAPLSAAQRRLWLFDQVAPGSPAYNVSMAVRLRGRLQPAALVTALQALVGRHETLRTSFAAVDGRPLQRIARSATLEVPLTDLAGLPQAGREATVRRLAADEADRPFDLGRPPLLRARLLRLGPEDHVLLLGAHHIVCDGWSIGVALRELAVLYEATVQGRPSPLPPLPIQYADYAWWQRQWLDGDATAAQRAYWQRQLADVPVLTLPTDRPRPAVSTMRGATETFLLPQALRQRLEALARRERATLFMVLLAAFKALLHRYTGADDLAVGSPVANRRPETEGLIGLFLNTLVLRTRLGGDPPFVELLARVREVALQAYAHQDLPFEQVVEAVSPARNLSHTPLFQVLFELHNLPRQPLALPGLVLEPLEPMTGTAKFDLTLTMQETPDGLWAGLEYSIDLFQPATIERLAGHLRTLLQSVAADPRARLSELELLTERERQQVARWNDTAAPFPEDRCLHELIEQQVARAPQAVALVHRSQRLTYRQLNARANQLAHHLRSLGVRPEVPVGVCLARSPELVITLLAILKAGGAYVPLDPGTPPERLRYMLQDTRAPVVVTRADLRPRLEAAGVAGVAVVCLDGERAVIAAAPQHNPKPLARPGNLVYIMYTSGSTGRPKGVLVEHRGLVNFLQWCVRAYARRGDGGAPLFSSFGFDMVVPNLYTPLVTGQTLYVLPEDLDLGELGPALERYAPFSFIKLTPGHLDLLAQQLPPHAARRLAGVLVVGADAFPATSLDFWLRLGTDTVILNEYGPTEATVANSVYEVAGRVGGELVPIGTPIPNTSMYVLDAHLNLVPVGVVGELYIGGACVVRGYLNRPGLTGERFVPNPFGPGRLYRTGDLGRLLPDGNFEFLGRIDHQVKIRGYRVEPGEVEACLAEHPAIRQALVVAREDRPGDRRLVAYLVPRGGGPPDDEELHRFLRERLPDYMVPACYVPLEAIPLNANGKVDRAALPVPPPTTEPAPLPPRSELEELLERICAELLGVERVGMEDSFFALGGDSIVAVQAVARARRAGLRISARDVFQHPTIAELAAVAASRPRTEQGPVTGPVPITPAQRRLLEEAAAEPERRTWTVLLEVPGDLQAPRLEEALARLLEHHDALRLRFWQDRGGWRQRNAGPEGTITLLRRDLSGAPPTGDAAALEAVAAELRASLDLEAGPRLGALLWSGHGEPGRLLLVADALAVDGPSWPILLEDLQVAYEQACRGEQAILPPKTDAFKRWAEALAQRSREATSDERLTRWLRRLGREPRRLPLDGPGGEGARGPDRTVVTSLEPEVTRLLLEEVPGEGRAAVEEVLLAAVLQALAGWAGPGPLLVELDTDGRVVAIGDLDVSRTVGCFTTRLPLLVTVAADGDLAAVLAAVKARRRQAPGHGMVDGHPAGGAPPRAEVALSWLGERDPLPPGELLRPAGDGGLPGPRPPRSRPLQVDAWVHAGRLHAAWTFDEQLLRPATVQRLAADAAAALRAVVAGGGPQAPEAGAFDPADFPLAGLSREELAGLLEGEGGGDP